MGAKREPRHVMEEPVLLPVDIHEQLKYLGGVDGPSVPLVIRRMIDNGIRQQKATDYLFREFSQRSA